MLDTAIDLPHHVDHLARVVVEREEEDGRIHRVPYFRIERAKKLDVITSVCESSESSRRLQTRAEPRLMHRRGLYRLRRSHRGHVCGRNHTHTARATKRRRLVDRTTSQASALRADRDRPG